MRVDITAEVNGATVFIMDEADEIYCNEEVLFGGDYETRLRATVDKLLKKAEVMEATRQEYQKLTEKIQKEYET